MAVAWSFVFVNAEAQAELDVLPPDVRANFEREARASFWARAGARALYKAHRRRDLGDAAARKRSHRTRSLCDGDRAEGSDPSGVHEEDPKDAATRNRTRTTTCRGGDVSRKMIPVEESFAAWRKDPEYEAAYSALEDEFSLAAALIALLDSRRVNAGQVSET